MASVLTSTPPTHPPTRRYPVSGVSGSQPHWPGGEVVRHARLARGWSQARLIHQMRQVAAAMTPPRTLAVDAAMAVTLSRWENGHQRPGSFYGQVLGAALGLSRTQMYLPAPAGDTPPDDETDPSQPAAEIISLTDRLRRSRQP